MFRKSFMEEWHGLLTKKMHFIVLFILPVLTLFLIGIELEEEVISDIPMAVMDRDQTEFSRGLTDAFVQNESFGDIYYVSSEKELEELIRDSVVRMGMIIPQHFYNDVATLGSPSVMMLYDGSHMAITGTAKAKAMEILLTYKAGATVKQLEGRLDMTEEEAMNVVLNVQFENRFLYNPAKSYEDFLAPILIAGYIQAAIALIASVSVNHHIFTLKGKQRVGYALGKSVFYTLAGVTSFMCCVCLQVTLFDMPFRGQMRDVFLLSMALSFAVSSFSVLISTLIRNRMVALMGGGLVFIPNSVMAGTTWPLTSMPLGYQGFAKVMPFAHYVVNLRDIYLKGTGLGQLWGDIGYLLIFPGVSLLIAEFALWIADTEDLESVDSLNKKDKEMLHNDLPKNLQEGISVNS